MIRISLYPFARVLIIEDAHLKPDRIDNYCLVFSICLSNTCVGTLSVPFDDLKGVCLEFGTLRLAKFLGPKAMEIFRNWCRQGRQIMEFVEKECEECKGTGYVKDHAGTWPCYYCGGKGKRWVPVREPPAS